MTVGGEVIVINADSQEDAALMAGLGLQDTIDAMRHEDAHLIDALAAKARLDSVGAIDRMNEALKPDADKSDQFVEDLQSIRQLVGDDIILAGKG